jgi:hypothetical protein
MDLEGRALVVLVLSTDADSSLFIWKFPEMLGFIHTCHKDTVHSGELEE